MMKDVNIYMVGGCSQQIINCLSTVTYQSYIASCYYRRKLNAKASKKYQQLKSLFLHLILRLKQKGKGIILEKIKPASVILLDFILENLSLGQINKFKMEIVGESLFLSKQQRQPIQILANKILRVQEIMR